MPATGYHACVLRPLGDFEKGSIRTITQGQGKRPVQVLIGRPKGKSTTASHSVHYGTDNWTEDEAAKSCKDAGGVFEAATKEAAMQQFIGPSVVDASWVRTRL